MTTNKPPIYCWDTCVFLAWFKEEQDKPLHDIELVIREIENRQAFLLLSITTYEEVLITEKDAKRKFREFVRRDNVEMANVDPRIADKVVEIQEHALAEGKKIKLPDAQIVATAVVHKADVLHTFDPKVLRFDGVAFLGGLRIVPPQPLASQTPRPTPDLPVGNQ